MQRTALILGACGIIALAQGCGALLGIAEVEYRDAGADQDATVASPPDASPAPPADAAKPPVFPPEAGAPDVNVPLEASLPPDGAPMADASPPTPTSCRATGDGLSNCGPAAESCCATAVVEKGTFNRTYQSAADGGPYAEDHLATVSAFLFDKYEITVGRFRQYVNYLVAGGAPPANGSGIHAHVNNGLGVSGGSGSYEPGWDATNWDAYIPTGPTAASTWNANLGCDASYATWTPASDGGHETLPINCLTWWQAYAFCIWDGGFLPTEAEWEYAAAGGSEQREYPWGSTDPGSGNQYAIFGCNFPSGPSTCGGFTNIAPVGTATLGGGRWGQLDLVGSMWEWNLDWYSNGTFVQPCVDCAYLSAADYRVFPGGSYYDLQPYLASSIPYGFSAPNKLNNIGARCARSP
jgi:sulfatase modifying factor 1